MTRDELLAAALRQVADDADRVASIYGEFVDVAGAEFMDPKWARVRDLLQEGMGAGVSLFVAADNLGVSVPELARASNN